MRSEDRRRAKAVIAAIALGALALGAGEPALAAPPTTPRPIMAQATRAEPAGQSQPNAQLARPGSGASIVRYAVPKRACARPTRERLSCDEIKLVPAAKGTHGALAYTTPAYSRGPKGGFTPADLATAYRYNAWARVNQTVAVVDAYDDPKALADLNAFDAHYGLPRETTTTFHKVNQNGAASPLPAHDAGWAGEIALDIETVRAVCHRCRILLVEAASPSATNLARAVNTAARLHATEITNSYGGPEDPSAPASVAAAYNHPGIVITAASGDHGWYDWDYANEGDVGWSDNAPNTPAAYPTVVSVGGTKLTLNADGTRHAEEVWNENGRHDQYGLSGGQFWGAQGASGGGCSTLYSAPAWQAAVAGYANTGCSRKRLVGDVAALADPETGFDIYDSYGSRGWVTAGGTSLSSPLVAAMWALAGGSGGVRYPAQSLYDNLRFRPSTKYDVTVGSNSFCGGDTAASCSSALVAETGTPPTGNPNNLANGNPFYQDGWAGLLDCGYKTDGSENTLAPNTQCNAVAGYDGPSGVGTPNGLNLFRPTRPSVTVRRPAVLKLNSTQTWSATRFIDPVPGGKATSYRWTWGDGTTSVTTGATTSHRFTRAGAHRVTVAVTDNYRQTGSATATITVGVRPTAVITGPTKLRAGARTTWSGRRSVDRNSGGRIVSWRWTLGRVKVGSTSKLTHKFAKRGTKTLTLTVTDNTGLRTSRSRTIRVR
jgi:hypothetical protein